MDDAWRERSRQIKSQFAARDALTELFLTRKIVVTYSDEEERDRLNAQRMQEAKQQHEQIAQILEPCGSWDAGAIIHLIERLQYKAENMISEARVLGMTTDPSILLQYGISKDDIDTVLGVHAHIKEVQSEAYRKQRLENSAKGGRKRTDEQQSHYNTHLYWWNEWSKDKGLYKNKTAYYEAMKDKTGVTERTLRDHVKEFTGSK
jgi:hypothetical protein